MFSFTLTLLFICLNFRVKEYVTEKIPLGNVDALYKDLDKLISLFKIHITSKLIPNLNKPGYEASHPAHQYVMERSGGIQTWR